jgi:hypothetical protein
VALYLDSGEGWKEPGLVFPEPGSGVVFRFEKPLAVDGCGLRVGFRGAACGLVLAALRKEGEALVPAAQAALFSAAEGGFCLFVPPGTYDGFALRRQEGSKKSPEAVRIVSAAFIPYAPVFRIEPSGAVEASSDIAPKAAGASGAGRLAFADAREEREYSVRLRLVPGTGGAAGEGLRITMRRGSRTRTLRTSPRPVPESVYVHTRFLGFVPEEAEISPLPRGSGLEVLLLPQPGWAAASASFDPVPADIGMIVRSTPGGNASSAPVWRRPEFEVFRWSLFPQILIFDSRDYEVQKRLFHRLAFYVEKTGFRGKLSSSAEIWGRHGWNAHNYNAESLAAFFNAARGAAFALHGEELWLADYLVSQGVLGREGGVFLPGKGGILGICQESSAAARELLLTHEAFHGVYYGLPEYRRLVEKTWEDMPREQKSFWDFYFTWMGYDTADHYLLVNEFQAYLLQQPLSRVDSQYRTLIAERLAKVYPGRREWLTTLFARYPDMFTRPARLFSDYLQRETGIRAGDVMSTREKP